MEHKAIFHLLTTGSHYTAVPGDRHQPASSQRGILVEKSEPQFLSRSLCFTGKQNRVLS